mmetsp:Transcript_3751/g.10308  ORF Transcript_3751/g.10308 Transcript_3751/m.10308 type:complete len:525 (-) Transcript_3751:126-1700(-)
MAQRVTETLSCERALSPDRVLQLLVAQRRRGRPGGHRAAGRRGGRRGGEVLPGEEGSGLLRGDRAGGHLCVGDEPQLGSPRGLPEALAALAAQPAGEGVVRLRLAHLGAAPPERLQAAERLAVALWPLLHQAVYDAAHLLDGRARGVHAARPACQPLLEVAHGVHRADAEQRCGRRRVDRRCHLRSSEQVWGFLLLHGALVLAILVLFGYAIDSDSLDVDLADVGLTPLLCDGLSPERPLLADLFLHSLEGEGPLQQLGGSGAHRALRDVRGGLQHAQHLGPGAGHLGRRVHGPPGKEGVEARQARVVRVLRPQRLVGVQPAGGGLLEAHGVQQHGDSVPLHGGGGRQRSDDPLADVLLEGQVLHDQAGRTASGASAGEECDQPGLRVLAEAVARDQRHVPGDHRVDEGLERAVRPAVPQVGGHDVYLLHAVLRSDGVRSRKPQRSERPFARVHERGLVVLRHGDDALPVFVAFDHVFLLDLLALWVVHEAIRAIDDHAVLAAGAGRARGVRRCAGGTLGTLLH